eukprot:TRINITY_DN10449_c0_g1_i5.p1 TRINITY_DN10449_c0_g1~~TRINITY_DN10449_c0_g1_i5.p1  ORF type:complete len:103 (+),score=18.04 TRINITY_DN10449_c0_g1_i5:120-428(+)
MCIRDSPNVSLCRIVVGMLPVRLMPSRASTTPVSPLAAGRSPRGSSSGRALLLEEDCIVMGRVFMAPIVRPVSYTHLRAHETPEHLVCRLLLEKKKKKSYHI